MNNNWKYFVSMTVILITVLIMTTAYSKDIYGDCKTIITTEVKDGIEVSRNETRVCNETELIGDAPFDPDNNGADKMLAGMMETVMLIAFIAILEGIN
tara:strand:- start:111 stop:404 length:294 start_codon:yes stop_codon:yes gene_type:complete